MTGTLVAPLTELAHQAEERSTGLRILSRRTVEPMKSPNAMNGYTNMHSSLIDSWELVSPASLCLHVSLRGRPRPYFVITRFDGPTLDRILKRLQIVLRSR